MLQFITEGCVLQTNSRSAATEHRKEGGSTAARAGIKGVEGAINMENGGSIPALPCLIGLIGDLKLSGAGILSLCWFSRYL